MKTDSVLFLIVFAVWLVLAILYATVPMLAMPGYAAVWGWGSLVFLGLGVLIAYALRRSAHGARTRGDAGGPKIH
jgi:membrane protein implicated in regulation of membrane protease activity